MAEAGGKEEGPKVYAGDWLWADALVKLLSPAPARSLPGDILLPTIGSNFSHCLRFSHGRKLNQNSSFFTCCKN